MKTIFTILFVLLMIAQLRGQKMRFEMHQIGEFRERMGQTSLVDVDICIKPWNGGLHIYLENKLIE